MELLFLNHRKLEYSIFYRVVLFRILCFLQHGTIYSIRFLQLYAFGSAVGTIYFCSIYFQIGSHPEGVFFPFLQVLCLKADGGSLREGRYFFVFPISGFLVNLIT